MAQPKIGGSASWDDGGDTPSLMESKASKSQSQITFKHHDGDQEFEVPSKMRSISSNDEKEENDSDDQDLGLLSTNELLSQVFSNCNGSKQEKEQQFLLAAIQFLDLHQGLTPKLAKFRKNYFKSENLIKTPVSPKEEEPKPAKKLTSSKSKPKENTEETIKQIKKSLKESKSVASKVLLPIIPKKEKVYDKPIIKGKAAKYVIGKNPCIEIDITVLNKDDLKPIGVKGTLSMVLFKKQRPNTVKNFLALIGAGPDKTNKNLLKRNVGNPNKKTAYYSYTKMKNLFHSVDYQNGLITGGDVIKEDGTGGIVSVFGSKGFGNDNKKNDFINHQKYTVAMVNNGSGTNGCQFYINMDQQYQNNFSHVVFGYIVDDKAREFMDLMYSVAFKDPADAIENTVPERIYRISEIQKSRKPVRYPVDNHLVALKNSLM